MVQRRQEALRRVAGELTLGAAGLVWAHDVGAAGPAAPGRRRALARAESSGAHGAALAYAQAAHVPREGSLQDAARPSSPRRDVRRQGGGS
ncbi:hypothetical protein GP672_23890 [Escherichia coli]|nr:hypothetical protein GP672_23890 [Escherichia coli]